VVFQSRQRGDYQELVEFSPEETEELISQSAVFVDAQIFFPQFRQGCPHFEGGVLILKSNHN
jgi:hypothetical protein